ncbi:beta-propeller domain-containing protein [Massilia glaciei]|uniref:Beta propeller domain-containing protein n=1 Tax=Massilia glaciei TaxID=1524097 RepID=A0A2U2HJW6_9BURK|nr:beta-propeller domain-containing protein [Massilia glaciei]PWF47789.1 hypothetical protein C7C56_014065 [Massilia glaciei]
MPSHPKPSHPKPSHTKPSHSLAAGLVLAFAAALACPAQAADTAPAKTLTAFASEAALQAFFKRYADEQRAREEAAAKARAKAMANAAPAGEPMYSVAPGMAPPSPIPMPAYAPPPSPPSPSAPAAPSASAKAAGESVTNTQTAGVDEGGIVKVHGQHLVMLRRGKLFTVDIGKGRLKPVSSIDAFAPGTDPSGSWFDEMLISGDTVAVIGYSYRRGGTEIGLFDIDRAGQLRYRATYHMRSNDYYSSRNYASRQIGSKLIFYTPLYLRPGQSDPLSKFPALRKWRPDATPADFERIAPATRIYRTDDPIEPHARLALHTVTVCDLAAREMKCEASAVLGPQGRVFYVSGESVYVWAAPGRQAEGGRSGAGLFRIPLDGGAPSALKVAGAPVDQFSFLESGDGHLNVLVRAQGGGEGMWRAERGSGEVALMRVPLKSFSDGRDSAPAHSYRALPNADRYGVQNRYVGAYLLYGSSARHVNSPPDAPRHALHAVRWDGAGEAQTLSMPHAVERIEAMGADAVVIGSRTGDLHFSSIKLGRVAELAYRYVRGNAAQSEARSHGFFYKSERADDGIVGLPITHDGRAGNAGGYGPAASLLYLRNKRLRLDELGSLLSQPSKTDDGCRASCVDWYGNARPLFLQGRVFALMGYELVEGKVRGERLSETRRISYAPATMAIAR